MMLRAVVSAVETMRRVIFKHTKGANGKPLVSGRRVTGFTNTEEEGVGLTKVVPFLIEDMLKANGGLYEKGPDWGSHVVVDGKLVTGQNPASSEAAANALLKLLRQLIFPMGVTPHGDHG